MNRSIRSLMAIIVFGVSSIALADDRDDFFRQLFVGKRVRSNVSRPTQIYGQHRESNDYDEQGRIARRIPKRKRRGNG